MNCLVLVVLHMSLSLPLGLAITSGIGEWEYINSKPKVCPTFTKIVNGPVSKCIKLQSNDVIKSLSWLTRERSVTSSLPSSSIAGGNCTVWSVRIMGRLTRCVNDLTFERTWQKYGCRVDVILINFGLSCVSALQLNRNRHDIHINIHPNFPRSSGSVDILRINDNGIGGSFAFLAAMYTNQAFVPNHVKSLSVKLVQSSSSLFDNGDREVSAHGWHIWATRQFLQDNGFVPQSFVQEGTCGNSDELTAPRQFRGNLSILCSFNLLTDYNMCTYRRVGGCWVKLVNLWGI